MKHFQQKFKSNINIIKNKELSYINRGKYLEL